MLAMVRILCFLAIAATGVAECTNADECLAEADVVETSLLQIQHGGKKGRLEPKHYIQMDGTDKINCPRREMTGFTREVLFKYPLASNPIKIIGKTARIEIGKVLESLFSRDAYAPPGNGDIQSLSPELLRPEEQRDFGVERAVAFVGKKSMVSNEVKLAFAEKSHTLYIPEEVSHASENRMKEIQSNQTLWDRETAKLTRDLRNTALSAFAMAVGPQIISAGKDFNVVAAIRNLSAADGRKPDASFETAMERANRVLKQREALNTRKTPVRSSIGCLHFESPELMNFTDEAVELPLDTKIVGYRGRLASTPNKEYAMSSGIAIFSHNVETDTLDIFFGFSSVVDMADSAEGYGSIFSVGPANGASMPVVPEGRADTIPTTALGDTSLNVAMSFPPDFSFLHSSRQDVGCPDTVLRSLTPEVEKVQDMLAGNDTSEAMSSLAGVSSVVVTVKNEVNCAVEYLRPWNEDEVVAFGSLEAVGLIHVLIEMPGYIMEEAFNSSKLWNTITLV